MERDVEEKGFPEASMRALELHVDVVPYGSDDNRSLILKGGTKSKALPLGELLREQVRGMFELNYPLRRQKRNVSADTSPGGRGSEYRDFISASYNEIPRFCLYKRREQAPALRVCDHFCVL